jgi:hypothetical protein
MERSIIDYAELIEKGRIIGFTPGLSKAGLLAEEEAGYKLTVRAKRHNSYEDTGKWWYHIEKYSKIGNCWITLLFTKSAAIAVELLQYYYDKESGE